MNNHSLAIRLFEKMGTDVATQSKFVDQDKISSFLLPREAYITPEWYARELEKVFGCNWYFAGLERDVPNVGDYSCVQVGAYPMFFLRDENGDLGAFHNMCRHRGAAILADRGNVQNGMTCFYHSWTYGLDGALKSVPQQHQFPGIKSSELGLRRGSVATFRGLVFVHTDPAEDDNLLDWMGDFPDHFGPYDLESYTEIGTPTSTDVAGNWKLFVENHIDGYHLFHLHKDSILGLDHDRQVSALYNNHWSIFEPLTVAGTLAEFEKRFPTKVLIPDDPKWLGSSVHLLFPNLGIATGAKWVSTVQSIPTGPTTSRIESRFFLKPYADGETEEELAYYPGSSEHTDLMAEDRLAVERLQVSVGSPLFECGPLATDYERSVTVFHESILSFLK
jgi:choline monooxygenase